MFYMINNESENVNIAGTGIHVSNFADLIAGKPEDIISLIPEDYALEIPVNLMFYTCHAQDPDANLIIMQTAPGQCIYFVNRTDEIPDFSRAHRLHRHNFYELMFVIDGMVYQNIEHQRHLYPTGSCCLLNPNVYHTEEFRGTYRVVFLQLSTDFMKQLLSESSCFPNAKNNAYDQMNDFFRQDVAFSPSSSKKYIDFIPLSSLQWVRDHVHRCFEKLLTQIQNPTVSSDFYFKGILMELLCHLFDPNRFQKTPMVFGTTSERTLFDAITRYLSVSHGHVSRRELEDHFHYSGDYLYKIVQKYTGLSIFEYGMKFCLKEAAELLTATSLPISKIAERLNFTNQTHFYRLFQKEYHMTPKAYRTLSATARQNPLQSNRLDMRQEDPANP